jgi:predicted deacetylase
VHFALRNDDVSFFTSPDELEEAFGDFCRWGPVSLSIIPFCRAGTSRGVPPRFRERWSIHPLHENTSLVAYLRAGVAAGRFDAMVHGYHHDEPDGRAEFVVGTDLRRRAAEGRAYLEDLLAAPVRVFVPPHNEIRRRGLRAVVAAGLHLAGTAGLRSGWSPLSRRTWAVWWNLRTARWRGATTVPWVLDLADHREIVGHPVTPLAQMQRTAAGFEQALSVGGVFCAATHHWELKAASLHPGEPSVGEQLRRLVERAAADPRVQWRSLADILSDDRLVA